MRGQGELKRLGAFLWYRKLLRNPYTRTLRRMRTRAICICVASALGARMSLATFFFISAPAAHR